MGSGLSIVVPTYNRADLLLRLLSSPALLGHSRDVLSEVLVVLVGRSDGRSRLLRELRVPYRLRVLEQVHGSAANARNHGWQAARGRLVLFLDDDVLPDLQLIDEHVATHALHPGALVVGRLLPDAAQRPTPWHDYEDSMRAKTYAREDLIRHPLGLRYAGNFSISRRRLEEVGGFDPQLAGNQEIDLGYRLAARGVPFLFNPAAVASHLEVQDYAGWRQARVLEGRFDLAMYRDQEYAGGLSALASQFRRRHRLTRVAVGAALRHRASEGALLASARALGVLGHRFGSRSLSRAAFSVLANILYWGGVRDGLRGRRAFSSLMRSEESASGHPRSSSRDIPLRAAKRIASVRLRSSSLR